MIASVRSSLLMLLGPPAVLLIWAHFIRPQFAGWDVVASIIAGLAGLAGLATAPWRLEIKATLAAVYLALALVGLPFLSLLAVCSTGDCL